MGCCESQFCSRAISKEEMLLEAAERILGLSNISSSEFITTVLQYSRDQYISIGNLNHCFKILNLDTSCFDNPKSLKHWFYRNFYKENSGYSINALVLIGIYLCKGEINEKAQLLFEIYDEKQIKLISYAEFHRLINEIVFLN